MHITPLMNAPIIVQAHERDNVIQIHVIDNGKGIPPEVLPEIFVPFYSTKKEGSGIGLSLSKQILHLHHGSIKVESNYGEGAVFTLQFPKRSI